MPSVLVLSVIAGIGITALCLHGFTSMDHALGMAMCGGRSSSSNDSMSVQPSESREQAGNRLKQVRQSWVWTDVLQMYQRTNGTTWRHASGDQGRRHYWQGLLL